MDPESGKTQSIWAATADVPKFEPLKENIQTDVCIIGAGITGLTTGYMLAREGKKVTIIDDGNIGGGETGRTTAHITNVIDDRFSEIESMHGKESTRLAAESQIEAINTIERIIEKEKINCDFKRVDGYLFFQPDDSADELEKEFNAAQRAGVTVEIASESPIKSFNQYPFLKFPNQAEFHSLKYISGLANCIIRDKGQIFTHTHAKSIEDSETNAKVTTNNNNIITAKDVVVATNSPISDYVAIHTKQAAYRTYVIGIAIKKNSIKEALYWDNEDPYHYVRLYTIDENDILIVGGEDHKTGQEENPEERYRNLEKWAKEHFENLGEVVYKWSGQVMEPVDGLSYIGKDPENSNHVYIATGDSGMGITHGTFSGIILKDLILGKENKWAEIYDPKRITLKAASEFIKEGANTIAQYVDYITPGDVDEINEIQNGEGAIIRDGLEKIAVYKDENGVVHKFSALCTHLKCVLEWNSAEKSWDCPCHGSRFDGMGNVLNGPALNNMNKL